VPIYEYECGKCGVFDYQQSIADRPLGRCPKCRSKVTKLISASAFHLKGGGWYADGYDRKARAGADPAPAAADATGTADATTTVEPPPPAAATAKKKGKPKRSGSSGKSSTS